MSLGKTLMVVNHASDERKQRGFVESYAIMNRDFLTPTGETITVPTRINFVHWPDLPQPFVHEELSEDLIFDTLYHPELDNGDDDEEEYEEEDEGEEGMELGEEEEEGEEGEEEEYEEDTDAP